HSFIEALPKFIYYVFQSINWLEYNEASGVPSLSKSTIEKIKFKIPFVKEQDFIVNILGAIARKLDTEEAILVQYQNQKKILLRNLYINSLSNKCLFCS